MNCKPPCMALIIKSDFPELIGLPVEVTTDFADFYGEFCWVVKTSRLVPCWNFNTRKDEMGNVIAVPDACLRPISGIPMNDEVTDDLEVVL